MNKAIIILGSSRSHGNTRKVVDQILDQCDTPLVDLNTLSIKPYDYEYLNQADDFIPLIERIVEFDTIVIATPIYWYTMSALMKIFIDRISDLIDIRKDLGRKLRGKKLFVIASFGTSLPKGFEDTFEQTCQYLGIEYLGTSFVYVGADGGQFRQNNQQAIEKAKLILSIAEKNST
jgi:multimeric flavodoxin WrbA